MNKEVLCRKMPSDQRLTIAIAMAHRRTPAGHLLALCHWRACRLQALRAILAASWWVSGDGQCRDETPRHNEYTFLHLRRSGYSIQIHIFYEERLDYVSILSRSERATAHDEEPPRHFERFERGRISERKEGDAEREPLIRFVRTGKGWECVAHAAHPD